MPLNAHPLVLEAAQEMANEWFEVYARENAWYRAFKEHGGSEKEARRQFVARVTPRFFEEARQALTDILAGDYPERTKEIVFEALCKDNLLRANRTVAASAATVPGELH